MEGTLEQKKRSDFTLSSPSISQNLLAKGRYYTALGLIADAALSQVLGDILDLQDIPELESHRLSELCRIFNSLEGLFIEDAEQVIILIFTTSGKPTF